MAFCKKKRGPAVTSILLELAMSMLRQNAIPETLEQNP
jgi:hypothetical protein